MVHAMVHGKGFTRRAKFFEEYINPRVEQSVIVLGIQSQ
jgi:hypothetical protein